MTTYMAKPADIEHKWVVIDAEGQTLGRLASEVASLLRGKHKPIFTPHVDTGDHVIIINAEKIKLTGKKWTDKKYYSHSNYPGGLKEKSAQQMRDRRPVKMLELTIKGMLPHNKLGSQIGKKLHVFAGSEHNHQAQQPEAYELHG